MYFICQKFHVFLLKSDFKYISLYSFEYSDRILELSSPKLISSLDLIPVDSTLVPEFTKVISNSSGTNVNIPYNFDKRYKDNNYSQDNVDNKKSKSKQIKKKRNTSSSIGSEDIFVDVNDDLFNKDSLDISLLKSRKLNSKTKKKSKVKIENLNSNANSLDISYGVKPTKDLNSDQSKNTVVINNSLTVQQLSSKLNIPEAEIITYLFLNKGISVTINQVLGITTAKEVALQYNFTLLDLDDNINDYFLSSKTLNLDTSISRPPIITILGHVDHGKTTLLDSILKTNLVLKESGGITQAISGYEMQWDHNSKTYKLIFLDTPGHQSFKEMRFRGARITDIVLLVIAFNDGFKPQTVEAVNYIKEMNLNCIVVITKTDNSDQNVDFILNDLAENGLIYDKWGGNVPVVQVSALTGRNIDTLLSEVCIMSNAKNFVANPDQLACGTIFESYLDKKQGPIAYIVIQNGTLKIGDIIASSGIYGRVKNIINSSLHKLRVATPSSVVQVLGFPTLPQAGSLFQVFKSDKEAKQFCLDYSYQANNFSVLKTHNKSMAQDINTNIKDTKLIIKTDTQGSLEAIVDLLSSIPQSKVRINIVLAGFGVVSSTDVELAIVTRSLIIAFNIDTSSSINNLIKKYNLTFKAFKIIYDLCEYVKSVMLDLIDLDYDKVFIGRACVRTVFNMSKGSVAGCYVNEGRLTKMSHICVYREDEIVYEGLLYSLKRIKSDVSEVLVGHECGVMCNYTLWQKDDIIDAYDLIPKQKTL
uniref:Translation initiation factor IF-2, chloroplastic n=1 Tax=Laurencieae sp. TaxID=2007162 RepID=A0A1Z1M339_9FLOR|nr:translation initiation factor 2 [Laurencieae sp.]